MRTNLDSSTWGAYERGAQMRWVPSHLADAGFRTRHVGFNGSVMYVATSALSEIDVDTGGLSSEALAKFQLRKASFLARILAGDRLPRIRLSLAGSGPSLLEGILDGGSALEAYREAGCDRVACEMVL